MKRFLIIAFAVSLMTISHGYTKNKFVADATRHDANFFSAKNNLWASVESDQSTQETQAESFSSLSEEEIVKRTAALFTADQKKTDILASVSMAQFILESHYGKGELAQNANNLFGMKCYLSGNNWDGSVWDGESKYTKQTKEQKEDGDYEVITADFRKYPCVENSIADHSAYLLGAKNGNKLRYEGLKGCKDYKKAIQIIKDGGYATSLKYVENICSTIEKWNLTQYDVQENDTTVNWYRVRKSWSDSDTQKGAYTVFENAKKCADANPGYSVFNSNGVNVYTSKATTAPNTEISNLKPVNLTPFLRTMSPTTPTVFTNKLVY